ncbi:MAG: hypothetical protein HYY84_13790 [Deltaproteobacteria bacterium]|nr:hypothetical protein [Deltaproteobacteria bacterium]
MFGFGDKKKPAEKEPAAEALGKSAPVEKAASTKSEAPAKTDAPKAAVKAAAENVVSVEVSGAKKAASKPAPGSLREKWERWRWPALVIALLVAIFFGTSYANSRKFHLVFQGRYILVKEGAFFPVGKIDYLPRDRKLADVYAPIHVASDKVKVAEQEFRMIEDLNARLFDLLFELAEADIADDETREFNRTREVIARADKVPGVPARKRDRLKGMRGDIAYREGQVVLRSVEDHLKMAEKWFNEAKTLGTSRFGDVEARLRDVHRRLAGLNTSIRPQREAVPETAPPTAPKPTPVVPPNPAPARATAPATAPGPAPARANSPATP